MNGLPHAKGLIRWKHGKYYAPYKKIIDTENLTQLHHEWIPGTADYRGTALVEADSHMHGFIDVIQILEGEITLLTEAAIGSEDQYKKEKPPFYRGEICTKKGRSIPIIKKNIYSI